MRTRAIHKGLDTGEATKASETVSPKPEPVLPKPSDETRSPDRQQDMFAQMSEQLVDESEPPPSNLTELVPERGVDRIVRSIFNMPDVPEEYEQLRRSLRFEGRASAMSHGELIDALDGASETAQRAAELVAVVKVVADEFEIHALMVKGALLEKARLELIEQKQKGTYAGRSSQEDVDMMAAKMFATEYRDVEKRRGEVRRTVSVVESLADRCVDRARHLSAMVARSRAVD